MADFAGAINSIPPVTRTLLIAVGVITGPCLLAIITPGDVALSWWRVRKFYEIWRPFTTFFFGGAGFPLLYDVFLIFRNSSALERDVYLGNTAEYAWLHVMLASFILTLNIPFGLPFLFRPLLHAQTYTWCRANPTLKVSIFGLITIPTSLYPPALVVLDVLTGGPMKALGGILGILAGHLWWFLSVYLPTYAPTHVRRSNPLSTPRWFASLIGAAPARASTTSWGGTRLVPENMTRSGGGGGAGGTTGAGTARAGAAGGNDVRDAVRHRWGSGQRLGDS